MQNPPATNDDLDALLPDRWKAAHPEAVLKFREQEQQQVADRKHDRRARRRRAKQLANRQEANQSQANSS